ncbi:hypothetical protein HMPREF0080_00272 [Anaeroglobus geminatus F0357]|uniref:Uncharacterized protein n=1 Tax=Anaeroglobus geminatus F0357 TaxID=861450 RepID=G9YF62_9FIRM|nr:hypothetical protein HMPREF0080_00272 [Anaeroglobus geminatus F0357]
MHFIKLIQHKILWNKISKRFRYTASFSKCSIKNNYESEQTVV